MGHTMSSRGYFPRSAGRHSLYYFCQVGVAVLFTAVASGAGAQGFAPEGALSVATDSGGGGSSWLETAAGVDFGLIDFDVKGSSREWNLGIGHGIGRNVGNYWSFLGGGLSVRRPLEGGTDTEDAGPLHGVVVKPWLGGCVTCELAPSVRLGMELRWAPENAAIVQGTESPAESRAGISVGVEW